MRKALKSAVLFALVLSFAVTAASVCFASEAAKNVYTNPETNYRAVIDDDADLLTAEEEESLVSYLKPLTEYSNVAVYTVSTYTGGTEYDRSRAERIELFGNKNSAVFMIDMYLRRIYIHRKGNMESYFTNSKANVITYNVSKYATNKEYGTCCKEALTQMLDMVKGNAVPMPMTYLSNSVIALMAGLLIAFIIAVATSSNYKKSTSPIATQTRKVIVVDYDLIQGETEKKYSPRSSDSSCGGSSCGGSSCGGSSCGGSSCGGSSF